MSNPADSAPPVTIADALRELQALRQEMQTDFSGVRKDLTSVSQVLNGLAERTVRQDGRLDLIMNRRPSQTIVWAEMREEVPTIFGDYVAVPTGTKIRLVL